MKLTFLANQVISCHLRLIYVLIFQQTASILNSLHPTVHCGHGIHYYCCRSAFFQLGVYTIHSTEGVFSFRFSRSCRDSLNKQSATKKESSSRFTSLRENRNLYLLNTRCVLCTILFVSYHFVILVLYFLSYGRDIP